MRTLIVATGARRLADDPATARASLDWLLARIIILDPVGIIAGDARGPDQWALDLAHDRRIPWQCYDKHGIIQRSEGPPRWWTPQHPPAANAGRVAWSAWLHFRNETMIRNAAAMRDRYDVRVVGALAASPGTRGTQQTLDCAETAGLLCDVEVF